jgi:DNA polymerase III alpha subunit
VLKFLAENDANYPDPQDHLEDPLFKEMSHFTPEADALWKEHFENNMVSVPFKYRGEERIKQVSAYKILQDLAKKYETTVAGFRGKEEDDESSPVAIDKFDSTKIVLDKDEESVLKSVRHLGEERTFPEAEKIYYGFEWVHQLETCLNYEGNTFDKYMEDAETNKTPSWMVEVRVEKVNPRTSKNGTKFFSVDIEDANGKVMVVNVWKDDMSRWKDEIKAGNLLKMRVRPPSGGFNTLTFESRSRQEKSKEWPDKANDYRVRLLIPPEPPKVVETIYDDFGLTELPGWEELS